MLRRRELFQRHKDHNEDSGLSRDFASSRSEQSSPPNPLATASDDLAQRVQSLCVNCKPSNANKPPAATTPNHQPPHVQTPVPTKKTAFSLPRLRFPGSSKAKSALLERRDSASATLPSGATRRAATAAAESSGNTTTTSAYNTGADTAGQESPVERQQRVVTAANEPRGSSAMPGNNKNNNRQRVVRFGPQPAVAAEDCGLPQSVFYTSAERLAETIAAQQRLLRQELMGASGGETDRRTGTSTAAMTTTIRVPMEKTRTNGGQHNSHQSLTLTPSLLPLVAAGQLRQGTPRPLMATLSSRPASSSGSLRVAPQEQQRQAMPPTVQQQPNNWPRADQLQRLFAFNEPLQHQQPQQPATAAKSGQQGEQLGTATRASSPNKQRRQELEWIVKRRPDGSRYVTRRPVRKRAPTLAAGVKARREQSLQRERCSGAMSTTDDDGGSSAVGAWWLNGRRRTRDRVAKRKSTRGNNTGDEQQQNTTTVFTVTTV